MKKQLITVIAVFTSLLSYSQENFLPGYVIPTKNDTLRGFIDYRNWKGTPKEVSFKRELNGVAIVYKPIDINVFGVLDEVYESAKVEIEVSSVKLTERSYNPEFAIEQEEGFLQAVVRGERSLYYLSSRTEKDQFYFKTDAGFELLRYKQFVNAAKVVVKNEKYKEQLKQYFNNESITSKINGAQYNRSSLEKLFNYYYKTTGKAPSFEKTKEKLKLEMSVSAGVSLTSIAFSDNDELSFLNEDFTNSTNPSGGISFDLIFPRSQQKWAITNELIYSAYESSSKYDTYVSADQYTHTNTTIGASYLKLNTIIRLKYPIGKMFMVATAGISNGFALQMTNEKVTFTKFYTTETTEKTDAISDVRKYEQGFVAGVGAGLKDWTVQARYEGSNGMSVYSGLQSSVKRFYFTVSYRFKK